MNLIPILDRKVNKNNNSVIYIPFLVGGSEENNKENIIYHIALADLQIDCDLLSPFLKWKLLKNGEVVGDGSFDYQFDTIIDGRLVLTNIQQDLKPYNKDKGTYDYYEFYIWISDSCQSENLSECIGNNDQSLLMNKKLKGKIEVELLVGVKEQVVRTPTTFLDKNSCLTKEGVNND